jgi:hypothetical protein
VNGSAWRSCPAGAATRSPSPARTALTAPPATATVRRQATSYPVCALAGR